VVGAFLRAEGVDEFSDQCHRVSRLRLAGLAQQRLELGEGVLERVKVGDRQSRRALTASIALRTS
jgi:hypothetical protein